MSAAPAIRPIPEEELEEPLPLGFTLRGVPLPATIHPERPLTDEELVAFCAENNGIEIECDADGTIRLMTPAKWKTSRLNRILEVRLDAWAEKAGSGEAFGPDLGIRFADKTLRAPDVAWISSARLHEAEEQDKNSPGFLGFCPEFIAEIRSRSDRASQIEAKMEFWMSRGAELGWLIDPIRKLAMVYRPGQEPETLLQPETLNGEGPIEGFQIDMRPFWS